MVTDGLNPATCATYFHDFLGRDVLVECDALDSNFFAPVRSLPNFAEATPCRNILGVLDSALDQQLCR